MTFDVRVATRDGVVAVTVQGEVDCATAPRLRATLDGFAAEGRTVLVDLSDTEFMDCAGVGVLVDSQERLRRLGGDLVVGSPSGPVLRVLELTGVLDDIAVDEAEG